MSNNKSYYNDTLTRLFKVLMMIRAVILDWMNTIARAEPDRHEQYIQVCHEFGIEASPLKVVRGIYAACTQVPQGVPHKFNESEDPEVFLRFHNIVLSEVGVKVSRETALEMLKKESEIARKERYVLYDDVLPTLETLKQRGLILGLLTTVTKDVNIYRELGLEPYLNSIVTSKEVGANKPEPAIFLAALERAGVSASEAVYVGDQYETDVVGARGGGIKPILIDRWDLLSEVIDCPRIHALTEVFEHL